MNIYKNDYFLYAKISAELNDLRPSTIQGTEIKELTHHIWDEKRKLLTQQNKTWRGWLVFLLTDKTGLVNKIHRFLQNFTWYAEEVKLQAHIHQKIRLAMDKIQFLENEQAAERRKFEVFKEDNKDILSIYPQLNNRQNAFNLMVEICGGQQKYDALPVLDLKDKGRANATDYIDFITPAMMVASVMKFTDKQGRRGIAIQGKNEYEGEDESGVQAFFERRPNAASWVASGKSLIRSSNYVLQNIIAGVLYANYTIQDIIQDIIQDGIIDMDALQQLEDLIQKGETTVFSVTDNQLIKVTLV